MQSVRQRSAVHSLLGGLIGYLTALPASLGVLALAVALLLAAAGIEAALIARR